MRKQFLSTRKGDPVLWDVVYGKNRQKLEKEGGGGASDEGRSPGASEASPVPFAGFLRLRLSPGQ